jgi:predicted ATPase
VEEPGRRVVEAEQASMAAMPCPGLDIEAFLHRTLSTWPSPTTRPPAPSPGPVFFDRGIIDALSGLQHLTGRVPDGVARRCRSADVVFLTPPWPEIYETDAARRHGPADAVAEYDRLNAAFPEFGCKTQIRPQTSPDERADLILSTLQIP